MTEEKSKVETKKEFDTNAIKWGLRVGITDPAIAKSLYWCVLNIYSLQQQVERLKILSGKDVVNEVNKELKKGLKKEGNKNVKR